LCFDQSLKAINSLFRWCNKQELRFNQRKTYFSFSLILLLKSWRLLWSRECGIGFSSCIDFRSFYNKCNPFVLWRNYVCEAEKCCVLLRLSRWAFLVVFVLSQRKCVSWGDQGHFFGVVVSNLGLIAQWIPQWFLGRLDVAIGLRVNQYKPVCAISLSLELFNFSLYLWTGINNRLFLRNNRLFFWCCVNCFVFLANWILNQVFSK